MHYSKITLTVMSLLATSTVLVTPVMAEMMPRRLEPSKRAERQEERQMERKTIISDVRKTNAGKEIDRRITAMTALITRVNNLKKLSGDQKASLVSQLQTAINDLTALKAKIVADTDPATLQTDKQSIVGSYRIFALLMPKVEILAHADAMLQTIDQMNAATAAFQTKVTASGKNVPTVQTLLADRQAKVADATTQAQSAITAVNTLTPAEYPANKTSLETARKMLATGRKDLAAAYQDLKQANQALKAAK